MDHIISIAIVLTEYNEKERRFEPIDEFHSLVFTHKQIDPEAAALTGITQSSIQGQPMLDDVLKSITLWLNVHLKQGDNVVLVGHNIKSFDNIMLYTNCVRNKVDFDEFFKSIYCIGFIDTLSVVRDIYKVHSHLAPPKVNNRVTFALGNLYMHFTGKSLVGAHDALIDCQATIAFMNAEDISSNLNHKILYSYFVSLEKSLKNIRASAGVRFQNEENANARERSGYNKLDEIEKGYDIDLVPILTEGHLCINCMSQVTEEHTVCKVPPKKWIMGA